MYIVEGKLVSEDLLQEVFSCDLESCKGACCWEGDFGAPLEEEEIQILEQIREVVEPDLGEEARAVLEKEGVAVLYQENGNYGTPLAGNGACVYMLRDERGIAQCGIEKAWMEGRTNFRKPLSCHLYPIRIVRNPQVGFEALNYDRWDICSAACVLGKKRRIPVYRFAADALRRKYGDSFVAELDRIAEHEARKQGPEG